MKINVIHHQSSEYMTDLSDRSVDLVVTSPPYNIDIKYGNNHQNGKAIGSKGRKYDDNMSEQQYRKKLKQVASEIQRVIKDNGVVYINMKNRYVDSQILPPFWIIDFFSTMYLKNIIIWNFDWGGSTPKRFSPRYEYLFFFTKNKTDWTFNINDIAVPSVNFRPDRYKSQYKNPSDVWRIPLVSGNFQERTSHPAQYPEKLVERVVLASTHPGDIVRDPFMGSGTTAVVAKNLGRYYIGYETEKEYIKIANQRIAKHAINIKETVDVN